MQSQQSTRPRTVRINNREAPYYMDPRTPTRRPAPVALIFAVLGMVVLATYLVMRATNL